MTMCRFYAVSITMPIFKFLPILFLIVLLVRSGNAQEIQRLDEQGNPIEVDNSNAQFVSGEVIIKFQDGVLDETQLENEAVEFQLGSGIVTDVSLRDSLLNKTGARLRRVVTKLRPSHTVSTSRTGEQVPIPDLYNLMVMEVDQSSDILQLCEELNNLEGIEYAEPNYILDLHNMPNDQWFHLQRGFEQSNDIDIDAAFAWAYTVSDYTVKIGIVDTGIDYDNEDLGGGDFGFEGAKVRGGWDYTDNDADPDDSYGHGTSCSGISGALRNNSTGVAGLAGGNGSGNIGCQLFAFRIEHSTPGLIDESLAIDAIIEASVWTPTFGYGCHILNNSWGGAPYNEALRNAVRVAYENNVVFSASTGNDNNPTLSYPARYDQTWTFAVGASNGNDERALYGGGQGSNYGSGIDFVAPGVTSLVYTTHIGQSSYGTFSGTSAAAPHVAGLAGLIRSENPNFHVEDVQGIIKASADKVGDYPYNSDGWHEQMGYGRINAGKALEIVNEWQIDHKTAAGGTSVSNTSQYLMTTFNPGGGLAAGTYVVKRYDARKTVSLPGKYVQIQGFDKKVYVWGRGVNETTGWSAANPNWQMDYCNVTSYTESSAELQTFVYEVWTILGQYLGWYPATPSNVTFAYTVAGATQHYAGPPLDKIGTGDDQNEKSNNLPIEYVLEQNYPNPFNPTTTIRFQLPGASHVSLVIYDLQGKEVASLVNGQKDAGHHQVSWDARNYSSGIYFYKLTAGNFIQINRMVLIK